MTPGDRQCQESNPAMLHNPEHAAKGFSSLGGRARGERLLNFTVPACFSFGLGCKELKCIIIIIVCLFFGGDTFELHPHCFSISCSSELGVLWLDGGTGTRAGGGSWQTAVRAHLFLKAALPALRVSLVPEKREMAG